ncbi:hypothetical protein PYW08_006104 [Mythimna loreyi]|uniref:Uncharacterized protein n=1 Tax=Mythimna loreyi TaxID=667449 RepID=A0ACC2QLN4_9NEOP|nr:hypothetical protein PYW08_006104 [Mythimna loreyi]
MEKTYSKEEVVIAQNANGAATASTAQSMPSGASIEQILLITTVVLLGAAAIYYILKKCHGHAVNTLRRALNAANNMSVQQTEALVDFLEGHKELALGRCSRTNEGHSLSKRLWQQCAEVLNSVSSDCVQKTGEDWRVFYNEYKHRLFKKIKKVKSERSATVMPSPSCHVADDYSDYTVVSPNHSQAEYVTGSSTSTSTPKDGIYEFYNQRKDQTNIG